MVCLAALTLDHENSLNKILNARKNVFSFVLSIGVAYTIGIVLEIWK